MSMDLHVDYAEVAAVAQAVAAPRDEAQQLMAWLPLVKRIVRQLNSQVCGAIDRDDMEQIGLVGLLEALRRYGTPDAQFAGYAGLRVRGAILDELRRQDWRPRSVRQGSHRLRDGVRELTRTLGRAPLESEIVAALGLTPEQYHEHQLAENAETVASFDELIQEMSDLPSGHLGPEDQLMLRRSLEQALGALDEREQRVIQMVYEFELSYREVAAVLDLTDARVCQLNKGALRKMKAFLQGA
jgi:RNA polymerase sigma factor for flagellar operon FliA